MRGSTARQVTTLALIHPDQLIPADHSIRDVKPIVEEALNELKPAFAAMVPAAAPPCRSASS
jgi:hypothetical protein